MAIKAVIFDFDGLMVDTETPAFEAWSRIFSEYGAELKKETWVQVVGTTYSKFHPVDHLSELTSLDLDKEALMRRKEQIKTEICQTQPLMPGVKERITEAKELGLGIAVVSTSEYDWVDGHLRRCGIRDEFEVVVTRESVTNVKPHPEPYLTGAQKLGVDAGSCIVFEDSGNGIKAAKAAGCLAIAVPNPITMVLDFSDADRRVTSLSEVTLADLT